MRSTSLIAVVFLVITIGVINTTAQTEQLPISVFIDAIPSTGGIVNWNDPITGNWLHIDMFGKRAALNGVDLNTTFSGSVTIRDLGDGTERVTILLYTRRAACWGRAPDSTGFNQLIFGQLPPAIAAGAHASLADALLRIRFLQPQGYPIPKYGDIFSAPRVVESLETEVVCRGEFNAVSGYPQGTPGYGHTTQVYLPATGVPAGCPPELDGNCYVTEHVDFRPFGN